MGRVAALNSYDEKTAELLREKFVLLAVGGYVCGEPYRSLVKGGRLLTAGGKGLNAELAVENWPSRDGIWKAWEAFQKLPEVEKKPPVSKRPELKYPYPLPPEGGLILKQHLRVVRQDGPGRFTPTWGEPEIDSMWLRPEEAQSLLPASAKVGDRLRFPDKLLERMFRRQTYHFTMAQHIMPAWEVSTAAPEVFLVVARNGPKELVMRLEGKATVRVNCFLGEENAGVKVEDVHFRLQGQLDFDKGARAWRRFDVAALGRVEFNVEHAKMQGHEIHTRRMPLQGGCWAFTLELADRSNPIDLTPPVYALWHGEAYFGKESNR